MVCAKYSSFLALDSLRIDTAAGQIMTRGWRFMIRKPYWVILDTIYGLSFRGNSVLKDLTSGQPPNPITVRTRDQCMRDPVWVEESQYTIPIRNIFNRL